MNSNLLLLERDGNYAEAGIQFLYEYKRNPILTFYFDGLIRNYKNILMSGEEVPLPLRTAVKDVLGFLPYWSAGRKKLAFIDHSYHAKTLSSLFIVEVLQSNFNVDILWSTAWKGCANHHLQDLSGYDALIYWQTFPTIDDADSLHRHRSVIVPMLDAVVNYSKEDWKKYSGYRFISFSKVLKARLEDAGLEVLGVQAGPRGLIDHVEGQPSGNVKPVLFFWQRTRELNWDTVKKKINPRTVSKIFLMIDADPGHEVAEPSKEDMETYRIELVRWQEDRLALVNILTKCDIYIAPRMIEGIGFSFLDAMACNCAVVTTDAPTMNEYIDDDCGYLVDYGTDGYIDFTGFEQKKQNALSKITECITRWSTHKASICSYVGRGAV